MHLRMQPRISFVGLGPVPSTEHMFLCIRTFKGEEPPLCTGGSKKHYFWTPRVNLIEHYVTVILREPTVAWQIPGSQAQVQAEIRACCEHIHSPCTCS
eukprot:854805-Pelagomonas_calceolata.AAC.3